MKTLLLLLSAALLSSCCTVETKYDDYGEPVFKKNGKIKKELDCVDPLTAAAAGILYVVWPTTQ